MTIDDADNIAAITEERDRLREINWDLLQALKFARAYIAPNTSPHGPVLNRLVLPRIDEAIAKAEGAALKKEG
jgi:hypothetical protein